MMTRHDRERRPRCRLVGVSLPRKLPAFCPLRTPVATAALTAMKDRAYRELDPRSSFHDPTRGLADLARLAGCRQCLDSDGRRLRRGRP